MLWPVDSAAGAEAAQVAVAVAAGLSGRTEPSSRCSPAGRGILQASWSRPDSPNKHATAAGTDCVGRKEAFERQRMP
jgi:hypothetical protein